MPRRTGCASAAYVRSSAVDGGTLNHMVERYGSDGPLSMWTGAYVENVPQMISLVGASLPMR
jgi:hypothetical protein